MPRDVRREGFSTWNYFSMSLRALCDPSAARAADIDQRLRERLAVSLDYMAGFLASDDWSRSLVMPQALADLKAGPVLPWVFGFYAMAVQHASRAELDLARQDFDELITIITTPSSKNIIALAAPALPDAHQAVARALFDTDSTRRFHPQAPSVPEFEVCSSEVEAAFALISNSDPDLAAEMKVLMRLILLAVPEGPDRSQAFNGASTFFLWRATLLNARRQRGIIETADLLIHEASHLLLFGLVLGGALSENDPTERYASPLRADLRPIDGIFHAAFVATRVHLAMTRMRASGNIPSELLPALNHSATASAAAARAALELLQKVLSPTPAGKEIFDAMVDYWQAIKFSEA